jgi:hypothetical protein
MFFCEHPSMDGAEQPETDLQGDANTPGIWVRAIADDRFRTALIDDPLRALAAFDNVRVSPEQVRQLEEMTRAERLALLTDMLRRAHIEGGASRFGSIGLDGRIGGPPTDIAPDD